MTPDEFIKYLRKNILPQYEFDVADASGESAIISLKRKQGHPYECSKCHQYSLIAYDAMPTRYVEDIPWANQRVFFKFTPMRIQCPYCKETHVEELPGLTPSSRQTDRFRYYLASRCDQTSIAEVARQYGLNQKTIRRIDKEFLEKRKQITPIQYCRQLGIDEIAIAKGHTYATVFYDHEKRCVLNIVEGRKIEAVVRFFDEMGADWCNHVEVVTMDLWKAFKTAVKQKLKNAHIVTDKFHVHKYCNDALEALRRNRAANLSEQGCKNIPNCRFLLLKAGATLNTSQQSRLEVVSEMNKDLYKGYLLKETVYSFYEAENATQGEQLLNSWVQDCINSGLKPFIKLGGLLQRNAYSILAYFKYRLSNGFAEGINNKIKVVKRIAFGFHDFEYFKLKILNVTGYLAPLDEKFFTHTFGT